MALSKPDRALVVVNSLAAVGDSKFRWLYEFCEASGVAVAEIVLKPQYAKYRKLTAPDATKGAFLDALKAFGSDATVKAIDVLLMLHGERERLHFDRGAVGTGQLRQELAALDLGRKLRMLYSTCCYGDSHSDDFVAGGFSAAVGSIAVNANSATEYPTVLTLWASGSTLKDAVAVGEHPSTRIPQDEIAKVMGFREANSDKTIRGNGRITIASDA